MLPERDDSPSSQTEVAPKAQGPQTGPAAPGVSPEVKEELRTAREVSALSKFATLRGSRPARR